MNSAHVAEHHACVVEVFSLQQSLFSELVCLERLLIAPVFVVPVRSGTEIDPGADEALCLEGAVESPLAVGVEGEDIVGGSDGLDKSLTPGVATGELERLFEELQLFLVACSEETLPDKSTAKSGSNGFVRSVLQLGLVEKKMSEKRSPPVYPRTQ